MPSLADVRFRPMMGDHYPMMTGDEFWERIASLNGTIDERAAHQLAARLSTVAPDRITGFADRLAEAVYALDSPDRADQPVTDPTAGDDPISMSDDLFLYARCAVVAAGRARWQQVLNDPTAMASRWPVFDGEWLLTVAPSAFEEATGHEWTHEPPLSVETGSNTENWPEDSGDTDEDTLDGQDETTSDDDYEPVATHRQRFEILGGKHQALPWRPTYEHVQNAYMIAINADPEWTRWWGQSGRRDLEIRAWVGPAPAGAPQIKVGRKRVAIDMDVDGRFLLSANRRYHLQHGHDVVEQMMATARQLLNLGPLPVMPSIPALPAGLDLDQPEHDHDQSLEDAIWDDWAGFRVNWGYPDE